MFGLDCLTGVFRRFRALVLGREVEVTGQCALCGRCCRRLLLRDRGRWLRRMSQYETLVASAPEHARFRPVGRSEAGYLLFSCKDLREDGCCGCYDSRPDICGNYPTKSLYYQGGHLSDDCGYAFRDVTFRDVLAGRKRFRPSAFSAVLQQEKDRQS